MTSPARPGRIANIVARGERRRRLSGIFWLLVAIAGASFLLMRDVPAWWYLLLALPFTMAALGVVQAREKT